MSKLNPQIKSLWLAALRSGHYAQGRGQLFDGERYCCLGVLCNVVDPTAWEEISSADVDSFAHPFGASDETLESTFRGEIGLPDDAERKLIGLNDGEKSPDKDTTPCDFLTIANWIEEHL